MDSTQELMNTHVSGCPRKSILIHDGLYEFLSLCKREKVSIIIGSNLS